MDPFFTNSPNFMDLLNSQQEGSYQPNNIQPCVVTTQVRESRLEEVSSQVREPRRKWVPLEDVVLCSAWLNTSKDVVVGNEQKHNAYWKHVGAYFNASPKLKGLPERDSNHCKQRWKKLNDHVNKFVGCYEAARKQQSNGQNEDDVIKLANEIYFQDQKTKFNLVHAWIELRNDQKWLASTVKGGSSSSKRSRDEAFTSSNTPMECDESQSRPEGVKTSKRKLKGAVKKESIDKLEQLKEAWTMKEKDYERKEKVDKLDLLHGLINKKEILTEIEVALKDKLIHDMLL